uniref:4-(cytidine 5'-diphospho)-2-C-methyl-D-erythritol kinase n=1 Tax=Aquiluna sp. TaxID=2053504 RepID=UPI0040470C3D
MIGAKAPAKINLFFEVGAARADGYHDVVSVYQSLDLFEEVYVEPAAAWTVTVTGDVGAAALAAVPADERNLVVKAAKALATKAGIDNPQPMHFKIVKRVPAAGGVAGGSADAAAALVALNEAWCLGLEQAAMMEVAAELGADVPFALLGGTALGLGSGTELTQLAPVDSRYVLLVFSTPGISTAESFKVFDRVSPEGDITIDPQKFESGFDLEMAGRNSLLGPALELRPDLRQMLNLFPGQVHLSGSGPTLYLLGESEAEVLLLQEKYQELGFETLVTRFGSEGAGLI